MAAPPSKVKRINEIQEVPTVKDESLFLLVQDGNTVTTKLKNFFARAVLTKKHDFVDNISYCGVAPSGTLDTSPGWTITKIEITSDGSAIGSIANNVSWSSRYTHNYILK